MQGSRSSSDPADEPDHAADPAEEQTSANSVADPAEQAPDIPPAADTFLALRTAAGQHPSDRKEQSHDWGVTVVVVQMLAECRTAEQPPPWNTLPKKLIDREVATTPNKKSKFGGPRLR